MMKYMAQRLGETQHFYTLEEVKTFFQGVSEKAILEAIDTGRPLHKGKDDWYLDEEVYIGSAPVEE